MSKPLLTADPKAGYLAHRDEFREAIDRVLADGRYILGPEVGAFEQEFADFHGGGHVMGVLFPGSDTYNRHEGSLMPTRPETLRAGEPAGSPRHVPRHVEVDIHVTPVPDLDLQGGHFPGRRHPAIGRANRNRPDRHLWHVTVGERYQQ